MDAIKETSACVEEIIGDRKKFFDELGEIADAIKENRTQSDET